MAGSLNLLPPSDKPSEGDSLELTNWRVDQSGQLRSRKGMAHQTGYLDAGGGAANSMFRQAPSTRFLGAGNLLYRSPGPSSYAQMASGFDGQPIGFASIEDFTWVMNQALQGCVNADDDTFNPWIPAPPSSAPTAAAGAQTDLPIATFDSGEAWTVTQPNGATGGTVQIVDGSGVVSVVNPVDIVVSAGAAFTQAMVGDRFQVITDAVSYGITAVSPDLSTLTLDTPYLGATNGFASCTIFRNVTVFNFDSVTAIAGQSLHIDCDPPGSWRADLAVSEDLGIGGGQNASDQFRLWIHASDPTAINQITVALDVNTGDFSLDYYSAVIPGTALTQSAASWTQVTMLRALDANGLLNSNPDYLSIVQQINANGDPSGLLNQALVQLSAAILANALFFSRTGSTPGKDWGTVTAVRITIDVSAAVDVNLDAFDVIGSADAGVVLVGDYQYYITFDTADGHESNPSPPSVTVTLNMQGAELTDVPVSPDPQVTARNIYREGGSLDGPLRVGTLPDNVTTVYADVVGDQAAQAEDTPMTVDNQPPPPALGVIAHLGRLVAFNTIANPDRYFWTPTAQPWKFPGSDDNFEGNWEDTGQDGDGVLGATSHGQLLVMYKGGSIWRLYGNPDQADPWAVDSTVGINGPRSYCNAGLYDYFRGGDGIFLFNLDYKQRISQKIDPIFKGDFAILSYNADGSADITVPPENPDFLAASCMEVINGRLYFSYVSGSGPTPDTTLALDLEQGRWYRHQLDPAANLAGGFSALYHEVLGGALLGALTTASGAAVYQLEQGFDDDGNAIPLAWQSKYEDQGLPDNPKTHGDLVIVHRTGDQNGTSPLVVSLYFNGGAQHVAIGTINAATRTVSVFPLNAGAGLIGNNCALRIEGNADTECIIFDAYLYWYVEARDGMAFDTGVIEPGAGMAVQIDQMELEVTGSAAGSLAWIWRGDLPGGSIVQQQTGSTLLTTTRRNQRINLPALLAMRKGRLIALATVPFQMHAIAVRAVEIAEYVDGTDEGSWTSREISYG